MPGKPSDKQPATEQLALQESSPNLAKLILLDILTTGRWPLLLLIAIFSSAMAVVFATHHTRQAIAEREMASVEHDRLDNEWRNLILEENALSEHSRVQDMALEDLQMLRPDIAHEVVVSLP